MPSCNCEFAAKWKHATVCSMMWLDQSIIHHHLRWEPWRCERATCLFVCGTSCSYNQGTIAPQTMCISHLSNLRKSTTSQVRTTQQNKTNLRLPCELATFFLLLQAGHWLTIQPTWCSWKYLHYYSPSLTLPVENQPHGSMIWSKSCQISVERKHRISQDILTGPTAATLLPTDPFVKSIIG